jgi:CubicO group peptidase (beta-lactamase class C family)
MKRVSAACVVGCLLLGGTVRAAEADARLAQLRAQIDAGTIPGVHSLLVIENGATVAQWYFRGADEAIGPRGPVPLGQLEFSAGTLHDIRSVTKSVVSILFGIVHAEGAIADLDTPVINFFPDLADLRTPELSKVRVRDALTMTTGLHWDERTYPYTDVRNSEIAMDIAADPYRYVLSLPIDTPPGTKFNYSGGDVQLIAGILERATGMPIDVYAHQKLFGPLGIERFEWSKNNGIARAASGLRLTTHDLGSIGTLMLGGGRWGQNQVVPQAWVEASTSAHIDVDLSASCGVKYGYLWWINSTCGGAPAGFTAIGNGGQRIWVVPSRSLVVAATAGRYNDPQQGAAADTLFAAVLAALTPNARAR